MSKPAWGGGLPTIICREAMRLLMYECEFGAETKYQQMPAPEHPGIKDANQRCVIFYFDKNDLSLTVEEFSRRWLLPNMSILASRIEKGSVLSDESFEIPKVIEAATQCTFKGATMRMIATEVIVPEDYPFEVEVKRFYDVQSDELLDDQRVGWVMRFDVRVR